MKWLFYSQRQYSFTAGRFAVRKKEFTSFDISAIIKELKPAIADSRVNNIYQFGDKTLIFKLHKADAPPIRLVMEAGRRIHTTVYADESPLNPPAFCMAMRKYLRGAWVAGIEQVEFERIVTVSFRTKTGLLRLVLELFGDGNIILTNEQGTIIQALIFKRMRDRNILRNETLVFPPSSSKNPCKVTQTELTEALKVTGEVEVVRALARFLGIGGLYAEEVLLRANVEKTTPCNTVTSDEVERVFEALQGILSTVFGGRLEPRIILDEDESYLDVVPISLKRYEACKTKTFGTFSEALDEFYLRVTAAEKAGASVEVDKLKQEAERLKRMVAEQEKSISEDKKKADRDKLIGDAIYAHFNELQTFRDKLLNENMQGKDWKTLIAEAMAAKKAGQIPQVYIESFDGKNLALNLCVDNLRFSLNLRRTLFENASEYYERGKRAKLKAAGASAALEDTKRKLAKIEQELREAEELKSLKPAEIIEALSKRKVQSKEWYEKFRWFISSDGFLVVAGKDVVSNEVLIKKYTTMDDVVFHAEITGAPFVVVKSEGKEVSEQTLREAGEFAASFSRAWRENAGSADVYWVRVDQLSKSGPSGESVPHGAFFVVGKRNWMRNTPLKVAIGIIVDEETSFVGGAVDAVKAKTKAYVVIVPGDYTGKELLTQILRSLMLKLPKEQREIAGKTSIEQIREFLPYTKGTISQKVT
ncbi:MAG: ribosome rescue protein RqcH [Candidatus Bathyarchaeota archaeon]|nr:ribosome rescue protein RqcH [Candidatus Bathyarchaeota archaeon]